MKKLFSLFALGMLTMSAWAANTYVKVASVDQLEIGKKYILVNEDANAGMGALSTTSTMYGTAVAISIDNEAVDIEGTSVLELTAHKASGDQGGWVFEFDENHFIAWISGNSLTSTHNTTGAISLNEQWYAAATDDGVILKSRNDESRILQYNSTSPRFACYTSSQKPAVLYVQDAGYTPPVTVAAPTLPESQEFENSLSVSITNNEEGADLMYAPNDGEFTEYEEALTITETTTVYAKAVKGDVESEVISATYTKVEPVVYTKPYVKVNSVDELEVGKKYIIVNEERKLAMGEITGGSTRYGSRIEIPIVEDVAYIGDTEVVELTLGKGTMDVLGNDTWTFEINGSGRYILWNSGNSLDAVTGDGATSATGAQWIADETEDGVVLLNKSDNARKLQYNASSPRFACYTTSQQPAVLYVEYEPQEEEGITTLSEANALEDGENFTFNGDAVVTICWKGSVYLRDESGYGQIVDSLAVFENGQVLNPGWNATKTSVNGWVKFIDDTNLSASGETNAELAAAQKITSVDESMLNAYVYVENVYKSFLPIRSITLEDGTNISLTGTGNQPAMGNYNIYGIIWKSGDKLVFEPVAWETYVAPPTFLRGDVNDDGAVTIADVAALADYLLSNDATDLNLDAADCDQNGSVGVNDVASLIDYILNGEWFD